MTSRKHRLNEIKGNALYHFLLLGSNDRATKNP